MNVATLGAVASARVRVDQLIVGIVADDRPPRATRPPPKPTSWRPWASILTCQQRAALVVTSTGVHRIPAKCGLFGCVDCGPKVARGWARQIELAEHEVPEAPWTLITLTPPQGWATPDLGAWVQRVRVWFRALARGESLACFLRVEAARTGERPDERKRPCFCKREASWAPYECPVCLGHGEAFAPHVHLHVMVRADRHVTPKGRVRLDDGHGKRWQGGLLALLAQDLGIVPGPGCQIDHLRSPTAYAAKYATKNDDALWSWASLRRIGIIKAWSTCGAAQGLARRRVCGELTQRSITLSGDEMAAFGEAVPPMDLAPGVNVIGPRREFLGSADGVNVPGARTPPGGGQPGHERSESERSELAQRSEQARGRFTVAVGATGVEVKRHGPRRVFVTRYVTPSPRGSVALIGDDNRRAAWSVCRLILPGWLPWESAEAVARGWASLRAHADRVSPVTRRIARAVLHHLGAEGPMMTLAQARAAELEAGGYPQTVAGLVDLIRGGTSCPPLIDQGLSWRGYGACGDGDDDPERVYALRQHLNGPACAESLDALALKLGVYREVALGLLVRCEEGETPHEAVASLSPKLTTRERDALHLRAWSDEERAASLDALRAGAQDVRRT